eukprot:gnl/Carplike_NY0171/3830_a5167_293.p1 GENE.gnl/Carplike_NY0171/3830_a5167_293~~gnl/Carplike_NY0171/3830_a5167_293.p1  ORF type:complete len:809 (-),score=222.94 gnl/Carplike_NY0171/3830_a5167_293:145-2508(-)
MVVDDATIHLIDKLFTVSQLVEYNISLVEHIDKGRKPIPDVDVIYFVCASVQNFYKIAEDYGYQKGVYKIKTPKAEKELYEEQVKQCCSWRHVIPRAHRQYRRPHIVTTSEIGKELLSIVKETGLCNRLLTLKELYLGFQPIGPKEFITTKEYATESIIFNSGGPQGKIVQPSLTHSSAGSIPSRETAVAAVSDQIASFFTTLGMGMPEIYFRQQSSSAESVATCTRGLLLGYESKGILNKHVASVAHGRSPSSGPEPPMLFIVDRSFDLVTPLYHSYDYEPFLLDIFLSDDCKGLHNTVAVASVDEAVASGVSLIYELSEKDACFTKYRYSSVIGIDRKVQMDLDDLQRGGAAITSKASKDAAAMGTATLEAMKHRKVISSYAKHVSFLRNSAKFDESRDYSPLLNTELNMMKAVLPRPEKRDVITLSHQLMMQMFEYNLKKLLVESTYEKKLRSQLKSPGLSSLEIELSERELRFIRNDKIRLMCICLLCMPNTPHDVFDAMKKAIRPTSDEEATIQRILFLSTAGAQGGIGGRASAAEQGFVGMIGTHTSVSGMAAGTASLKSMITGRKEGTFVEYMEDKEEYIPRIADVIGAIQDGDGRIVEGIFKKLEGTRRGGYGMESGLGMHGASRPLAFEERSSMHAGAPSSSSSHHQGSVLVGAEDEKAETAAAHLKSAEVREMITGAEKFRMSRKIVIFYVGGYTPNEAKVAYSMSSQDSMGSSSSLSSPSQRLYSSSFSRSRGDIIIAGTDKISQNMFVDIMKGYRVEAHEAQKRKEREEEKKRKK